MLHKNAKIELLKRVPLFAGCSKKELAKIALLADELDLPEAREITRQGASGREFLVIAEGSADVLRNGRVVNKLGPGDFFGEIALVTGQLRTAAVRTRGPARVLVVEARAFRSLMSDVPQIQGKVLRELAARIPHD
ncbi:MAG TPA: cyclic nucleotide-binding domain-containing protein [Gaiellaceae bacterium]|nr:cyclic nucleotide-binding domain-containing protein [Gaiellaceae bacterium]